MSETPKPVGGWKRGLGRLFGRGRQALDEKRLDHPDAHRGKSPEPPRHPEGLAAPPGWLGPPPT